MPNSPSCVKDCGEYEYDIGMSLNRLPKASLVEQGGVVVFLHLCI